MLTVVAFIVAPFLIPTSGNCFISYQGSVWSQLVAFPVPGAIRGGTSLLGCG
jgi:hypothetical protein